PAVRVGLYRGMRARLHPPALLEAHHVDAGLGKAPGECRTGRAGADHEHVDAVLLRWHGLSSHEASRHELARSRVAVASSSRRSSMPPMSSRNCTTDVALAIGAVMPGRWASHERATCAGVAPDPAATFSTASRIAKPRSFMSIFC